MLSEYVPNLAGWSDDSDRANSFHATSLPIPPELLAKWQQALDLLAEVTAVRVARIMRLEPPHLTVLLVSQTEFNLYEPGEQLAFNANSYCAKVITENTRLLVVNAHQEACWDSSPDLHRDMLSYLGLPLNWPNGEVFGTISLLDWKENEFNSLAQALLKQFQEAICTDLLALSFQQRQQSADELLAQKQLFENLVAVARVTAADPNLEATLQNVVRVSVSLTQARNGSLFVLHGSKLVTYSLLSRGKRSKEEQQSIARLVMDKGVAGWVARRHQTALVTDTSTDPRWLTLPDQSYQVRSALVLPIVRGPVLLGILTLLHGQPDHFSASHVSLMQAAADQIALALDNARLYSSAQQELLDRKRAEEQLRQSETRYRAVSDMTSDYTFALKIDEQGEWQMEWLTDAFTRITGYTLEEITRLGGLLSIVHPEDKELALYYTNNLYSGLPGVIEYRIITRNQQVCWLRTYGKPEWDANRQRVVRILSAGQDITDRKQDAEELQQANRKLTDQLKELGQHALEIKLLNQMGALFRACSSTREAYQVISQMGQELFPNDAGALYVIGKQSQVLDSGVSWGNLSSTDEILHADDCWALRRGRIHVVEDTTSGLLCKHLFEPEPGSYLCVPMMAQGAALGVFHLTRPAVGRWTEQRQELASTVAEHIALALANLDLQETLRIQSIRDPLTALFNRRYMEESLERELLRANRNSSSLAIIMLDLDHFKRFNDTFGHDAGDLVLREIGTLLQSHIRGEDIACRYGGEEFILILPGLPLTTALRRAEDLRRAIKKLEVVYRQKLLNSLTVSQGVAIYPQHGSTIEEVMLAADNALYEAKSTGRDRVLAAGKLD